MVLWQVQTQPRLDAQMEVESRQHAQSTARTVSLVDKIAPKSTSDIRAMACQTTATALRKSAQLMLRTTKGSISRSSGTDGQSTRTTIEIPRLTRNQKRQLCSAITIDSPQVYCNCRAELSFLIPRQSRYLCSCTS